MLFPRLSIVILNYNGAPFLERCLSSLKKQTLAGVEVIVYDNLSTDRSRDILRKSKYAWIKVIESPQNLFFAKGYNQAIQHASGEILFLLNNDTWVKEDCCEQIVAGLEDGVGAYAPRQMDYEGNNIIEQGVAVDKYGFPFQDRREPFFYAEGSGLVIRKELFEEMGGFDENMVMIFEDNDLCWRLRLKGYKIKPLPNAIFYHKGGATIGGAATTGTLQKGDYHTSIMKRYYGEQNQLRTLLKNYSAWSLVIKILPQFFLWKMLEVGYWVLRGRLRMVFRVYVKALLWNMVHLRNTLHARRNIQKSRVVPDKEIRSSMVKGNAKWEMFKKVGIPKIS